MKGWKFTELKDVTNNLDSRRIPLNSTQRAEKESNPVYPYIGANNIMGYIDEYIFDEKILCVAEDGGSWGRNEKCATIYNGKVWVNNHAHVLTAKNNLNLEFLLYYLNHSDLNLYINGATRGKLTKSALNSIQIPLPPLPVQQKIAAILDAADEYRQKTKALVAKYDQLAQSLFLDLFGDPVSNPKGWEKQPLEKLMTIVRGGSPRPIDNYLGGSYPWIKIGDATKGDDIYLHSTKEHIIEEGLKKTRLLPPGSLIFANCGVSLGFARIISFEGCIHDGWLAMSDIDETKLDKIFLLKSLNSITEYFRRSAPDGTQPNLNTSIMKSFEMILPPLKRQVDFKEALEVISSQKAKAQASLQKAEELFQSLLQRAFKGELV
ncbi:type I restriction enzyme S subunit [Mangrovibacterium marinum]|uniref:Type I restriction enzyme S subunit n=1 Tax=Mangrovibacterium marinum TaxID=1639118 RepID=A0A2T5C591_9BACT|nr:restriction endonuclease subunit S [Mangrovibacterium marinum]PTN10052.1 type I restriction enzyme S subunit [Mangrovibacterium marinum]